MQSQLGLMVMITSPGLPVLKGREQRSLDTLCLNGERVGPGGEVALPKGYMPPEIKMHPRS